MDYGEPLILINGFEEHLAEDFNDWMRCVNNLLYRCMKWSKEKIKNTNRAVYATKP
jgi:hypothetical protein